MNSNTKRLKLSSRLIISVMFLIGLLFLGVSEAKESWCMGNMFSAIGQTLIGSSVVSFFLTLEDVQTFFLGMVKEIMIDNNYAKIFSPQHLEKMHSTCHQLLHFQNMDVNENDWKDLSSKCIETITSPYYSHWRENIECHLQKTIIEKKFNLDFELINPLVNKYTTANVSRSYFLDIPEGGDKNYYISISSLSIELAGKEKTCHPYVEFSHNDNKVYKTKASIRCEEYNLEEISFKNQLKVKIKLTTRVLKEDKSYTHRLRYSARHYLLNFTCTDNGVSIYPNFYGGFIQLDDFDRHNGDGHILIECKDRLILSGSGASIVLNINEKNNRNETRRELLKAKKKDK